MRTALLAWSFFFRSSRSLPLTLSSLWVNRFSCLLYLTISRTTASTHPVTQGSTALPLSTCCVVARRSASRWWSQWPCQSSAVLHSFLLSQAYRSMVAITVTCYWNSRCCQPCIILLVTHYVFQQDSAPAHRARNTDQLLQQETPEFTTPDLWKPNSRDLNPVDYFVWGLMQEQV